MVLWGLFIYFYQQGSELPSRGDTKPSLAPMLLRIAVAVTGVDMNLADIFFLPFRCPYCCPEWCVHTGKKLLCSFTLEMWLVCRPQRAGTETCGVNVPILAQQQEEHRGQPVVALYWNYLEVKLPEEPGLSSGSSEAPAPCSHDPILGGEGAAVAAPHQTMSHPGHICPTAPRGLPALGVQLSAISCTANK